MKLSMFGFVFFVVALCACGPIEEGVETLGKSVEGLKDELTREPATPASESGDPSRVRIEGPSRAPRGRPVKLVAEVVSARGVLEFEWHLTGRGSLMTRDADPHTVTVIGSAPGSLTVTVRVRESGEEIASKNFHLIIE